MNQLCPLCFHAVDTVLDDFETAHKRVSHKTKQASCVVPNKTWGEYVRRQEKMASWKSKPNASACNDQTAIQLEDSSRTGDLASPARDYYPGSV